jgi:antibiotic biosynthesis monooxygenase (ABM) superfamily enzyme
MDKIGDKIDHTLAFVLHLVVYVATVIGSLVAGIEIWLRDQLAMTGLPRAGQTVVLVTVLIVMILGCIQMFAGLIRFAVMLLLVLLMLDILIPAVQP